MAHTLQESKDIIIAGNNRIKNGKKILNDTLEGLYLVPEQNDYKIDELATIASHYMGSDLPYTGLDITEAYEQRNTANKNNAVDESIATIESIEGDTKACPVKYFNTTFTDADVVDTPSTVETYPVEADTPMRLVNIEGNTKACPVKYFNTTLDEVDIVNIPSTVETYPVEVGTPMKLVKIEGKTIKSDNLLNIYNYNKTLNGITVSIVNNEVTLNGTATDTINLTDIIINTIPQGTYTFKSFFDIADTNAAGGFSINLWNDNFSSSFGVLKNNVFANSLTKTITFNLARLQLFIHAGDTYNNYKFRLSLVKGSTAPSDFQIPFEGLKSVSTSGIRTFGYNLFSGSNWLKSVSIMSINGNIANNSPNYNTCEDFISIQPNSSYRYVQDVICDGYYFYWYDENLNYISNSSAYSQSTTILSPSNASYVRISVYLSGGSDLPSKCLLTTDLTATINDYEPYKEPTQVSFPKTELKGVETAKDSIELRQQEDGLYSLIHKQNIKEYIFSGNEQFLQNWRPFDGSYAAGLMAISFNDAVLPINYVDIGNIMSQDLSSISYQNCYGGTIGVSLVSDSYDYSVFIRVPSSIATNHSEFLSWIGGKKFIYQSKTPVETVLVSDLTYEQATVIAYKDGTIQVANDNAIYGVKPNLTIALQGNTDTNYTAGYYEGLKSVSTSGIKTVGKNICNFTTDTFNNGSLGTFTSDVLRNNGETLVFSSNHTFMELSVIYSNDKDNFILNDRNGFAYNNTKGSVTLNKTKGTYYKIFVYQSFEKDPDYLSANNQLEYGSTATAYEPYSYTQITFPKTESKGVGTVKDSIELRQQEDGSYSLVNVRRTDLVSFSSINTANYNNDNYISYYVAFPSLGFKSSNVNEVVVNCDKSLWHNIGISTYSGDDIFWMNYGATQGFLIKKSNITGWDDSLSDSEKKNLYLDYITSKYTVCALLTTPVETVLASNLTYEQVTAIAYQNGTIEVLNDNAVYGIKPNLTVALQGNTDTTYTAGYFSGLKDAKIDSVISQSKNLYTGGDIEGTQVVIMDFTLPQGTYTISALATSNDTDATTCRIEFFNPSNATDVNVYDFSRDIRCSKTFTLPNETTKLYFYASSPISSNGVGDNFSFKDIQIELNSTATAYEPYKQPYVIEPNLTLGKWDGIYKSNNLFNMDLIITREDGKLVNNHDGTIIVSKYGIDTGIALQEFCPTLKVGDIIFFHIETTGLRYIHLIPEGFTNNTSYTITQEMLDASIYFYNNSEARDQPATISAISITYGTTAPNIYLPYTDKPYMKVTNSGKVDLGTLDWTTSGTDGGGIMFQVENAQTLLNAKFVGINEVANIICSKYKTDTYSNVYNNVDCIITGLSTNGRLYIKDSSYADETTFKQAMRGVILHYELATPTYTPLYTDLQYKAYKDGKEIIGNENAKYRAIPTTTTHFIIKN